MRGRTCARGHAPTQMIAPTSRNERGRHCGALVHRLSALLQLFNEFVDPLSRQVIETHGDEPAVLLNMGFELLALVTHGLPRGIRREHNTLSHR